MSVVLLNISYLYIYYNIDIVMRNGGGKEDDVTT